MVRKRTCPSCYQNHYEGKTNDIMETCQVCESKKEKVVKKKVVKKKKVKKKDKE